MNPSLRAPLFGLALLPLIAAGQASAAPVLPTGGKVVAGQATIVGAGKTLTIDQTSARAIIDWSSFSIGAAGAVKFDNGSGATLNRVTGDSGSLISGLLSGTGSVYLINSRGVIVGKHGVVNVGGTFAASTLDVANSQFLAGGSLTFSGPSTASVVNYGKIGALGGDVALIAATVDNAGSISAANGTAGLAAGYRVILRDRSLDNGKFAVLLGGSNTSVTNAGVIAAADAELRANGGNIYALAGNATGIINATGVKSGQGKVWLVAEGGALDVAGTISAQGAKGSAGVIETSGQSVSLGKAAIDAHGGAWLLDPVNLDITQAAAATISQALATSDITEETTATGSSQTPGVITSTGAGDITLDAGANIAWTSSHALTLQAYNNLNLDGSISLASGALNLTAGAAIAVNAPISISGAGAVNITAAAPTVSTASGALPDLQLTFANGASINYGATNNGGTLSINSAGYTLVYSLADLSANSSGPAALATSLTAPTTAYSGTLSGVDTGGTFEGLGNSIINLKTSYGLFRSNQGVLRDLILSGGTVTDGAPDNPAEGFLAQTNSGLIANISVSGKVSGGTSTAAGDAVGDNTGAMINVSASGSITGNGKNIGGLVGTNEGAIEDSNATGSVGPPLAAGTDNVGGLAGTSSGTVSNSWAGGSVAGVGEVGGLVGSVTAGAVTESYATGSARTVGDSITEIGGLVGNSSGAISFDYATGNVNGGINGHGTIDAGLVAVNNGSISQSFATGHVIDSFAGIAGGLVAENNAIITNAFATGEVSTVGGYEGGLAGLNDGKILASYATGYISTTGSNIGGLVGAQNSGVSNGYYDAGATGQSLGAQSNGSVGLDTPSLQANLPAGFSSSVWGQVAGVSYPYLLSFFPAGSTPQVVSGAARATTAGGVLAAPISAAGVDAVLNGSTLLATTSTGANGYYYFLLPPGTLSPGSSLLTYLSSGSAHGNAVVEDVSGTNIKGLALYQNALVIQTPDSSLSVTEAGLASALGSATSGAGTNILFSLSGGSLTLGANDSLEIAASGPAFTVDAGISLGTGLFKITAAGVLTQTAGVIAAGALQGSSVGGSTFNDKGNEISQLTGWSDETGSFSLADAGALSVVGEVTAATGIDLTTTSGALSLSRGLISTSGGVTLNSAGALTEAAGLATISALGELTVASVGGATLEAANKVGSLSVTNTGGGAVIYKEAGALAVVAASNGAAGALTLTNTSGELDITGTILGGKVTLTSAGGITEIGAGAITAATLMGSAGDAVSLGGANDVATLSKFTATGGDFALNNSEALVQSSALNVGGNQVSLTTTEGNIAIDGTIEASTLALDSKAGSLTESTALGAIKVGTLNATAAKGITLTSTKNSIGTIGVDSPGSGPNKIIQ